MLLELLMVILMVAIPPELAKSQDFETFVRAHWTVTARDKGMPVPFYFFGPQRIMEYEARKMRQAGKLVRIKGIKTRQCGFSTYCTARNQHFSSTGFSRHTVSIADKISLPRHWLDRAKVWHEQIPEVLRPHTSKSNAVEMVFDKFGSVYQILSQLGKTPGMGDMILRAHLSELSDWADPKKIVSDLYPCVPKDNPLAEIWLEGTGWMVGTWWHEQVMLSLEGGDDFKLIFIPWFIVPSYCKPPIGVEIDFTEAEYTDEEKHAVHLARVWAEQNPEHAYLAGFKELTLGHIAWRRWTIRNEFSGDITLFSSKYPVCIDEAFMDAGSLSLPLEIIKHHMETVRAPLRHVRLRRDMGGKVIADVCDMIDPLGWAIYEEPKDYCEYAVGGDPAEGSLSDRGDERSDRDRSAGAVMDRRELAFVADFRMQQIASDLFGEQLRMAAEWYNMAYLGAEFNNNGQAAIMPCKHYPNMLMRTGVADDIDARDIRKLWWKNTEPSRKEMINTWIKGCRYQTGHEWRESIKVCSDRLVREEKTFVKNPAGKDEHRKSCFDDLLFAYMICYWTHLHTPHVMRGEMDHLKPKKRRRRGRNPMAYAGGVDDCKGV